MNKVLFLRRGYGISQEEIAKKLKTSRKSVREKENGKKDWNKTEMIELTNVLTLRIKELGNMNLKNIRKEKGLTLSKLSSISSISTSYLSELEKGKYEATESKIIRLSLALGITPNELLGWEEIIENLKSNLNNFI